MSTKSTHTSNTLEVLAIIAVGLNPVKMMGVPIYSDVYGKRCKVGEVTYYSSITGGMTVTISKHYIPVIRARQRKKEDLRLIIPAEYMPDEMTQNTRRR